MSIFNALSDFLYYLRDSLNVKNLYAKIEFFNFNNINNTFMVTYRLGKKKLLHKMELTAFEKEYFEKVSSYDQHRITKFSTLQSLLHDIFFNELCTKEIYIKTIMEYTKNEQLF